MTIDIHNYYEKVFGIKIKPEASYLVDGRTLGKMLSIAGTNDRFNSTEVQKVFKKASEFKVIKGVKNGDN